MTQGWLPTNVVHVDDDPIVLPSALKHGVRESDLLHALRFAHGPVSINDEREPPTIIYVGTGTSGVIWYEVGISKHEDYSAPFIVHADKARKSFLLRAGVK